KASAELILAKLLRLGLVLAAFCAAGIAESPDDLTQLSIEDLANVQVTSVSKKTESLSGAPAAIFVLTGDEIRRHGHTSLPEALRMVPGLYVAQTDAHIWQVSARGFSDLDNNKMLVLIDGRSAYSPELGTVYWDALDVPLENIDRVEIIRGPGGTLWGDNAVNGVINIVTKPAQQEQGISASSSASEQKGYSAGVRYGGQINSKLTYSLYGRSAYWEPFQSPAGTTPLDQFGFTQAGARVDWQKSAQDTLSFETSGYDGKLGATAFESTQPATYLLDGANLQAHWKHVLSDHSSVDTMAYCAWYVRYGAPGEKRNSCDVEFQRSDQLTQRQSLIWGGSFYSTGDDLSPDQAFYSPDRRRTSVSSGFAQYEVLLIPDRLRILGGTKIEHNDYTGFEYQPQIRAVWTPDKVQSIWSSISRSIRTPSRNNSDLDLYFKAGDSGGEPIFHSVTGNPNLASEKIVAYETGYRVQPFSTLSFDTAIYYNAYADLIVFAPVVVTVFPTYILSENHFVNGPGAQTHGAEFSGKYRPISQWTLSAAVTETRGSAAAIHATPLHLFNLQSQVDLPRKLNWDAAIYHDSSLPLGVSVANANLPFQRVPSFFRIDTGGSWHLAPHWTVSVWGRNLQSPKHVETRDTAFGNEATDIPRSITFKLVWQSKPEKVGSKP
ncbi:MAG TPA: TonB-dependent receptor, partial [Terriglobales bacterium]|nr:TonB-dependent receptor [Terriglobales bacterium]